MAEAEAKTAEALDPLSVAESSSYPNLETPRMLSAEKQEPICIDGFEPSGRMNIAQVNKYVLKQGQEKMSKSDSELSIFLDDEEVEVNDKIKEAYCPPKVVEGNPCLDYVKNLVLPKFNEFTVERGEDNGANKTFKNFEELVADYESGELHPGDLKLALSKSLNKILEPVRENFRKDPVAKELLQRVKEMIKESTKN